ncbi:GNAT family N-acetyltransferase [Snuella lapsa]|uniref:GNAT family N-acetyltransferase n=1 Tax=Snuella lapsa TaxID=870481 RepID=A0ABP6Y758_9FLAO
MDIKISEISAQETHKLRHEVMWPHKPRAYVVLGNDEEGKHFGLFKDSNLISVVSLFLDGKDAQFRKFATKTSEQGNGYGTLLLNHLMTVVSNDKRIKKLWCNARADKIAFYERFGMIQTNKRFAKGGVKYIIMERTF